MYKHKKERHHAGIPSAITGEAAMDDKKSVIKEEENHV
jgi:hypothetical protein